MSMFAFIVGVWVTIPYIRGRRGPQAQKMSPNTLKLTQFAIFPYSNSIVRGYPSLKSPEEYLCHVRLPCCCPGGP